MPIKPTETKHTVVKCKGEGGLLGHPVVFLNLGDEGRVVCPYCSKCFVKASFSKTEAQQALSKSKVVFLLMGISLGIVACEKEKKTMELGNPASLNCIEKGGKLQLTKGYDGGSYGICLFPDNRQCEEWAMFRAECPQGGADVSHLTTPGGIYCALKGGKVLENETRCQLPSGTLCSTQEFYEGKCP